MKFIVGAILGGLAVMVWRDREAVAKALESAPADKEQGEVDAENEASPGRRWPVSSQPAPQESVP
jgi:hypothetical protein